MPRRPWLTVEPVPALDGRLHARAAWQTLTLARDARRSCDVLYNPGGGYVGGFRPMVTMCRNYLPFDPVERRRYGFSRAAVRFLLLRYTHMRSFRAADGLIFLTRFCEETLAPRIGKRRAIWRVIPHGVSPAFRQAPRPPRPVSAVSERDPFQLLYVSRVTPYKHQWHVVAAAAALREQGLPVELHLVGPAYRPSLRRLQAAIATHDPRGEFVRYHGPQPYESLARRYHATDLFVFASSCETIGNILLEAMSAGLPLACSNRGPMPEVVEDAARYFDPERPEEIAGAIVALLEAPELRAELARRAYARSQAFSWERCAADTFQLLADVARGAAAGRR